MLFKIPFQEQPDFDKSIRSIKNAYWPKDDYLAACDSVAVFPLFTTDNEDKINEQSQQHIDNELSKITADISTTKLYKDSSNSNYFEMPFLQYFHSLFLQRKWGKDPRINLDSPEDRKDLVRLYREGTGVNYSKNVGNFHHFINVVAATAKLINYFSDLDRTTGHLVLPNQTKPDNYQSINEFCNDAYYDKPDSARIFRIMLAAFYHDLGKTVNNRRHGMEGAIIISDHKSRSWFKLKAISEQHLSDRDAFKQEDLLFISEMLLFHDVFGTLSTGESGYLKLLDFIDSAKRYGHSCDVQEGQTMSRVNMIKRWARRNLFDLWIINVADIMVSVTHTYQNKTFGKFVEQPIWSNLEKSFKHINSFLSEKKQGSVLIHDLRVANKLLETHTQTEHSSDLSALKDTALGYTRRHVANRICRLIRSTLSTVTSKYREKSNDEGTKFLYEIGEICDNDSYLLQVVMRLTRQTGDQEEFCNRASMIGHMDYALGFFSKIVDHALKLVFVELNYSNQEPGSQEDCNLTTRWVRPIGSPNIATSGEEYDGPDYSAKVNASFFIENYTSTIIKILNHLLFREKSFDKFKNLEFSDAQDRLTNDKIMSIMGIDGPNWANRSTYLIMQSIFYW